jgi:hypothetical protein
MTTGRWLVLTMIACLAACGSSGGGSSGMNAAPVQTQPPAPPPPPPPPPPPDAVLSMVMHASPQVDLTNTNLTCADERVTSMYGGDTWNTCKLALADVIATGSFEVRVDPGSVQDVSIDAESVRSATLTLGLGPAFGSKKIVVPVINMAGSLVEKETYWCAENTRCDRWWWETIESTDGSNKFRTVDSWIDEASGDEISVGLGWTYESDATGVHPAIVVKLKREIDGSYRFFKEATVEISGQLNNK